MKVEHHPVSHHLGDDARRRYGYALAVSLHYRLRRVWAEVFGNPVAVDKDVVRLRWQFRDRQLHGLEACLQDVDLVDLLRVDRVPSVRDRVWIGRQHLEALLPLLLGHLLAVIETSQVQVEVPAQHASCSHDRTNERTSSRFIHPSDQFETLRPLPPLVVSRGTNPRPPRRRCARCALGSFPPDCGLPLGFRGRPPLAGGLLRDQRRRCLQR
mmetsp:Transcript_6350/g.18850  ORF Transcript_6350/g.18850 Transcript_6350/m.18850 type:complete len:212 (+) Transcript_6350:901-1536(+)